MQIEKIKICFVWVFALFPSSFLIINIVLNSIYGLALHIGDAPIKYPFDVILIEQFSYFSVWTGIITSTWGCAKIFNYYNKNNKKIIWAESENVLTMVFVYNFASTLVFTSGLIFAKDTITDFATPYSVVKSVFEHWVVPVIFAIYYFIFRQANSFNLKQYLQKSGWKAMIIPTIYAFYIVLRSVFLNKIYGADLLPTSFPYEQFDPYNMKVYQSAVVRWLVTVSTCVGAILTALVLSVGLEYFSLKTSKKFQTKFVSNNIVNLKLKK